VPPEASGVLPKGLASFGYRFHRLKTRTPRVTRINPHLLPPEVPGPGRGAPAEHLAHKPGSRTLAAMGAVSRRGSSPHPSPDPTPWASGEIPSKRCALGTLSGPGPTFRTPPPIPYDFGVSAQPDLRVYDLGHLGLVASVLDSIRLVETVDRLVGPRPGEKSPPVWPSRPPS